MKQNSSEYRLWLKRRNEKNLRRRTRKKALHSRKTITKTKHDSELRNNENYFEDDKTMFFSAPNNFSFIDNPEATILFFRKLIRFVNDRRNFNRGLTVYIDIADIQHLTTDALMYLLAVINDLNDVARSKFSFKGNEPIDELVKATFKNSGFYKYVRYSGVKPLKRNEDNLQILSGEDSDVQLAKQVVDFVCEKTSSNKRQCSFLYNLMIELMSNTRKHAYNTAKHVLKPRWYCSVELGKDNNFLFTFFDTGEGIPMTVQKRNYEKADLFGIKDDYKYVTSAMDAESRTSTFLPYRGKGLPRIRKMCSDSLINSMHIITNKADVIVEKKDYIGKDLDLSLQGTLFTWRLNSSVLQED